MKFVSLGILCFLILVGSSSCGKEVKGLREEIKILKEENSFLKAENIVLKKELDEVYKKLEEKMSAGEAARMKSEVNNIEKVHIEKPKKPVKTETKVKNGGTKPQ